MINNDIYTKVKLHWDSLVKPLDALGDFEDIVCRIGAVSSTDDVKIFPAGLLVFCSDNGVISRGISQSDEKVTEDVTILLGQQKSSVCHMAKAVGIDVFPVNLGVKNSNDIDGVDNTYYIAKGTKDFLSEPAMDDEQLNKALNCGKNMVKRLVKAGYKTILLGEMGIGNTTTSTAVISSIMELTPAIICGKGSGLSDAGLQRKIEVIDQAIAKYDLYNSDVYTILKSVGGFDIAAMVGAILEAYELSVPIILDGIITASAALCAYNINSGISDIIFFSHNGKEKGVRVVADKLSIKPIIDGNLALGEGTGAVMFMSLLKCAISVYDGNTSFNSINMDAYERFI